jgi:hypothetical protein
MDKKSASLDEKKPDCRTPSLAPVGRLSQRNDEGDSPDERLSDRYQTRCDPRLKTCWRSGSAPRRRAVTRAP